MKKQSLLILLLALLLCACLMTDCAAPPASVEAQPSISSVPAPLPMPPPTPIPTPTPMPDALTVPQGVYTIAWMSDTQYYSQKWPETFRAVTAFLRDEAQRMDLRYFVHTGDLVNRYDDEAQWANAVRAMSSLARLPGGVLAGNHDVHGTDADYENYSAYFGESQSAHRACYGESYRDNRGHYDLWEAGDTQYLFVYMGYAPNQDCLDWVRSVFDRFPDRIGVLCLHDYFKTNLSLSDDGQRFYDQVVSQCPNLYMVLCGHRYNIACVPASFDDDGDGQDDRTVYQMIGNYQAAGQEGGGGYMRFLQIDEAQSLLRVYSYSPVKDDYVYFDEPGAQEEKYAVDPAGEYAELPLPWA